MQARSKPFLQTEFFAWNKWSLAQALSYSWGGGGAETGQGLCARGAPVVLGWTWAEESWLGKYIRLRTYVWEI